ncbi:MAG: hypothetical protein WD872_19060 [Pirellulaceae bacterium]
MKTTLGWGPWGAGLLLLANVVVPLVWGDVYPFTSAPMFRDNPRQCCNYRVYRPDGIELPAEDWLCHRVYDGNPVGYGVGIKPPAVLEQEFGVVHDEAAVRRHVRKILAQPRHAALEYVEIVQEVIGPVDDQRVGVVRARRLRIGRSPMEN